MTSTTKDQLLAHAQATFTLGRTTDGTPVAEELGDAFASSLSLAPPDKDRDPSWSFKQRLTETVADAGMAPPTSRAMKSTMTALRRIAANSGNTLSDPEPFSPDVDASNPLQAGRELRAAMVGRVDVFRVDTRLARVLTAAEDGRALIAPMDRPEELVSWTDSRLSCGKPGKSSPNGALQEVALPAPVARNVLAHGEYPGVHALRGISRSPVLRPDGTIVTQPGFDEELGVWLDLDPELTNLDFPAPEDVTPEMLAAEVNFVTSLYSGFAYATDADKANAIGLLFSVPMRHLFPLMLCPLHVCDASVQSSGKTLLMQDLPGLISGYYTLSSTADDDEIRKAITTVLGQSSACVLCFDNVPDGSELSSAELASVLTSTMHTGRLLGGNKIGRYPNDRLWTATGNRITVDSDLRARSVLVRLEPKTDRPEAVEHSIRLDDTATRSSLRPQLVRATLLIMRAWLLAGAPERSDAAPMRQFSQWAARVGGLLEFINIAGHLENHSEVDELDSNSIEVAGWLHWIHARNDDSGSDTFTTAKVVKWINDHPNDDEVHPHWIATHIVRERSDTWTQHGKGSQDTRNPGDLTGQSVPKVRHAVADTLKRNARRWYAGIRVTKGPGGHANKTNWQLETTPEFVAIDDDDSERDDEIVLVTVPLRRRATAAR